MKNFAPNHPLRLKILIDKVSLIPLVIPCCRTDFITLFYFYLYFYVGVLTSHDSLSSRDNNAIINSVHGCWWAGLGQGNLIIIID